MADINEICFIIAVAAQLCLLFYVIIQGIDTSSFGDIPNWKANLIGAATGSLLSGLVALSAIYYNNLRQNKAKQKRLLAELSFELDHNYGKAQINFDNWRVANLPAAILEDRAITDFLKEKLRPKNWSDADIKRIMRIARLIRLTNALFNPQHNTNSEERMNLKREYSKQLMHEITMVDESNLEGLGKVFEIWWSDEN